MTSRATGLGPEGPPQLGTQRAPFLVWDLGPPFSNSDGLLFRSWPATGYDKMSIITEGNRRE